MGTPGSAETKHVRTRNSMHALLSLPGKPMTDTNYGLRSSHHGLL